MLNNRKIYILYTGGTIGCEGNPLSPMDGFSFKTAFEILVLPQFISQHPGVEVKFDTLKHTFDSSNIQPSDWVRIAKKVLKNYSDYDGFVILHGTDTMAWTASALSFFLKGLSKPVILTGSQLPLFKSETIGYSFLNRTDALNNLLTSMYIAGDYHIPEVCIFFATKLLRGNRAEKINSGTFLAFDTPNFPCLGTADIEMHIDNSLILNMPSNNVSLDNNEVRQNVMKDIEIIEKNIQENGAISFVLFPANNSDKQSLIGDILFNIVKNTKPTIKGIVLEAFGKGNAPTGKAFLEILKQIHDDYGVVLVDSIQVRAGSVNFESYATGKGLRDIGAVSGQDITSIAALTKLIYLIGLGLERDKIELMMRTNFAGEITSNNQLDGRLNDFLSPGESLYSISGLYQLIYKVRGNLCLYFVENHEKPELLWSISTDAFPGRAYMNPDGNFIIYDRESNIVYSSETKGNPNSKLVIDNSGNVCIVDSNGINVKILNN